MNKTTATTKKSTLTAILPDGKVRTRTTARTYTHVIAIDLNDGEGWGAIAWCGNLELAEKRLISEERDWLKNPRWQNAGLKFQIVEVQS